ncbi:MAG: 2'-5' RNA ligase family protein [Micrococcaceae bacterium]|nr:2'-5' RNA ligase family protein [Micrococcaceae bacterium]
MSIPASGTATPGATGPGGEGVGVGIVIPLPEPHRSELREHRLSFGDPVARSVPPHITLITGARAADWAAARAHVRRVAAGTAPFSLRLHGTETFRPVSQVVVLRVTEGFDACVSLHRQLQAGPLETRAEFPFHPHLTLAHDLAEEPMQRAMTSLAGYDATFPVDRIGLFEYDAEGLWALQEELTLGQDGAHPDPA